MKPVQRTLGILRHKADNYCQQPVGIWIHGRLVKGLRASAHRNPCNRIFLGMREGVGGKQQGQGRCGKRYDPFLHLSRVYIEPGRGRSGPPVSTDSTGGGRRRPVVPVPQSAWREGLASLADKPPGEAPIYSISVGP